MQHCATHYLLGLSINKHDIVSKPNLVTNIWSTIEFIIVDEISIIVCNMLATMHLKLQKIKSNILPFGGVFLGDYLQFPPITNTPLYSNNIQPTFAFTKLTQKTIISKSLWENYICPNNIILT
jgi:hypothetical protein